MKNNNRSMPLALLSMYSVVASALPSSPQSTVDVQALNQRYQQVQLQIQQQQLDNELAQLQLQHAELLQQLAELNGRTQSPRQAIAPARPHQLVSTVRFTGLSLTRYQVNQQPHWHRKPFPAVGEPSWPKR